MYWDVVIVGGGGAALCAALSAAETGAKVLILSKTKLGLGNCTAVAGGNFTVGVGGFRPEKHQEKTRETGRWINDAQLVEILAAEGPTTLTALTRYDVKMDLTPGMISVAPYAARVITAGTAFTLPLVRAIQDNPNISIEERALVTEILIKDNKCHGVEYLDLKKGSVEQVRTKAAVVATGGFGQLYERTDNPVRTTGDGYALIYNLGLTLTDMEFVQFFPLGFADPNLPGWMIPLSLIDHVPLTNNQGYEFLRAKLPEWGLKSGAGAERYARDRSAQTVAKEIAAGRGAYLHLNKLPATAWESGIVADLERMARGKIDLKRDPVAVAPTQHFCCGGIVIGTNGETEVAGLFACGEVAAGVHGANRVGGNALTELVVFGTRAGKTAAAYAAQAPAPSTASTRAGSSSTRLEKWQQGRGMNPKEFKSRLQALASQHLGVLRSAAGLNQALEELEALRSELANLSAPTLRELQDAVEAENLYLIALMVARAALFREESRGVHYREDFPAEDDQNWRCNIYICRGTDGTPELIKRPLTAQ